jgi:hypothetical protein
MADANSDGTAARPQSQPAKDQFLRLYEEIRWSLLHARASASLH